MGNCIKWRDVLHLFPQGVLTALYFEVFLIYLGLQAITWNQYNS